ncbi:MAG: N-acetyltransferase family protein [Actinomycetia bacterium]|nr:N-acetyltransferase family protein [Actinomycetes bacterium]
MTLNEQLGIRLATADDSQRILDIYRPYVVDTAITFVSSIPSAADIALKMQQVQKRYPYLVCTLEDRVVGFAYADEVRPHDAYRWNAELAIYLDGEYHRRGIATALYSALLQILRAQGFVNLYAVIGLPNDPSIALHRHFGFTEVGVHEKTGFKLGEWRDVVWLWHRIEGATDPALHGPPLLMAELRKNDIDTALNMAGALLKGAMV